MFQAVRNRLKRSWRGGRAKRLFGLFAFEFFVVVLGVLTAQAVQSWAQSRALEAETDEQIVRLELLHGAGEQAARVWLAANPCLRERVEQVLRFAASGETLPAGFSERPKLGSNLGSAEGDEFYRRIASRIGEARANALYDMSLRRFRMSEGKNRIIARWELFRLIDRRYGTPSEADRAAVRFASAEILADLRSITIAAEYMIEIAAREPVTQRPVFDPGVSILPIRNCTELWAKGTAYRMLDTGESPPY